MFIAATILLSMALVFLFWLRRGHAEAQPESTEDRSHKKHWLVGHGADRLRNTFHLGARQVTAGRAPSNYIQLAIPGMSRRHCAFYVDGEHVTLVDMSSCNGTRVNGRPIQTARLSDGDVIELAGAMFTYRRDGDYGVNAAWAAKDVGRDVQIATLQPKSMLHLRAQAAYRMNGGDVGKTATDVGISVDKLEELLAG